MPDPSPSNFESTLPAVVLDTNVLVAAGFSLRSASASIVRRLRRGEMRLVWNDETRREIQYILRKIPPLSWEDFEPLFQPQDQFTRHTSPEQFTQISDPDDRKFAALAQASGATLVTQDDHLLAHQTGGQFRVMRPQEYLRTLRARSQRNDSAP